MSTNPFAIPAELHAAGRVDTSVTSIRSDVQLPAAVKVLAACEAVRKDVKLKIDQGKEHLSQAEADALEVPFRGKPVPLKVFEEHLRSHVADHCRRRGARLFPVGHRTRVFEGGSISLRTAQPQIGPKEGWTDPEIDAHLERIASEAIARALAEVHLTGIVRVKVEIDRRGALKVPAEQLGAVGLQIVTPEDVVSMSFG